MSCFLLNHLRLALSVLHQVFTFCFSFLNTLPHTNVGFEGAPSTLAEVKEVKSVLFGMCGFALCSSSIL